MPLCCAGGPIERVPRPETIKDLPGPVDELKKAVGAENVALPDTAAYKYRRWHGDRKVETWSLATCGWPAAICTVHSKKDVQAVVKYAADYCQRAGVPLAIANGRHSHISMPNSALVIDMSALRGVEIDTEKKIATIAGGCISKDIHDEFKAKRLACCSGNAWNVGVCGQFLHGGHGLLERKMGMSVDNIIEIEVVTANGELLTCNEKENQDLFWGLRGAGSNFGVCVSLTVRLIDLPSDGKVAFGQSVQIPKGPNRRREILDRFVNLMGSKAEKLPTLTGGLILPCGGPVIEQLMWLDWDTNGKYFSEAKSTWDAHVKTNKLTLAKNFGPTDYCGKIQQDPQPAIPLAGYFLTAEVAELTPEVLDIISKMAHSNCGQKNSLILLSAAAQNGMVNENTAKGVDGYKKESLTTVDSTSMEVHESTGQRVVVEGIHNALYYAASTTASTSTPPYRPKDAMAYYHVDATWHIIAVGAANAKSSSSNFSTQFASAKSWADQMLAEIRGTGQLLGTYNVVPNGNASELWGENLPVLRELKTKYDAKNLFSSTVNVGSSEY